MDEQDWAQAKLKNKSGASLVFVLAIMLCLMIISVSVLAAAAANAAYVKNQREHNQILLLNDSVHKNIMYSLQKEPEDENLLSYQLIMALYDAQASGTPLESMPITLGGVDLNGSDMNVSVTISFTGQDIKSYPAIPAINVYVVTGVDDEGNETGVWESYDRIPEAATVNAEMTVTVVTTAGEKTMTTKAKYKYEGGALSDDPDGNHRNETSDIVLPMAFTDGGVWSLIRYEKADTQL